MCDENLHQWFDMGLENGHLRLSLQARCEGEQSGIPEVEGVLVVR